MARTGLPLICLDLLYWKPGWSRPTSDEWSEKQRSVLAGDAWIADGNYAETLPLRLERADTIVVLDAPWCAKKTDAVFRISFARRNSRFSRSSSFNRARSSLVRPGRLPSSISTRRTQLRNVSGVGPNFAAIEQIAAHCDAYSP
jgi:hypothetical protein